MNYAIKNFIPAFCLLAIVFVLAACGKAQPAKAKVANDPKDTVAADMVVAQIHSITIDVEELTPPKALLEETPYETILHTLSSPRGQEPLALIAYNDAPQSLVQFEHPFFDGMYRAYAEHRPFVLSPDAVWLLICQGFSQHVHANAEKLRPKFVDFEGKKELQVRIPPTDWRRSDFPWENYFPQFTKQVADYVGTELVQTLRCDFSTTTPTVRTASEISVMASMQDYFTYSIITICGIPSVTLEGLPEDWQAIVDKVQVLRQYDLDWWVDAIEPILKKIVLAAQGEVDKSFWRSMFKYHRLEAQMCGDPTSVADGWIVKFYPYNSEGVRNNLTRFTNLDMADELPAEVQSVPLKVDGTPLTLWTGFVGLTQDSTSFALRPEVGWFITESSNEK